MNFDVTEAIDRLIEREKGFVDHPNDKGGPTNYGITEAVARAYGYKGDMRNLPRAVAVRIYLTRYWIEPRFVEVVRYSERVAEELFDTGVNMGPNRASRFLQRSLNAMNRSATQYPDLIVDGRIGNMTMHALETLFRVRAAERAERVLLRALNALQGARYIEIAEADPTQEDFVFGWFDNRIGALS